MKPAGEAGGRHGMDTKGRVGAAVWEFLPSQKRRRNSSQSVCQPPRCHTCATRTIRVRECTARPAHGAICGVIPGAITLHLPNP